MARFDRMSAIFWVVIAIVICEESIRLRVGSLSEPGPGLIPLGCGLLLGILGIMLFIQTLKIAAAEGKELLWEQGTQWGKLGSILISLIGYAFLLEFLGFPLVTLIWMGFICRLEKTGWKATIFISVISMLSCYFLFVYCLAIRFSPRDLWVLIIMKMFHNL